MATSITSQNRSSNKQVAAREKLFRLFKHRPMSDEELLVNLGMYMRSGTLAKVLFLDEVYKRILNIPGSIFEFGVWMGQSIIIFENLRAIYEPYNYQRRIVGFDTFSGYTGISEKDKRSEIISEGIYTVQEGYENYLNELVSYHEEENVMSHIKKHRLIKGDAEKSCPDFIKNNPEILVALAYFDMALYTPTKKCLENILPRLIRGSVLVFDELCHPDYPGETQALMEILSDFKYEITRSKYLPDRTYLTVR